MLAYGSSQLLFSQNCTLGIATASVETLTGVFQLKHAQEVQLKTLKEVANTQLDREQQKIDDLLASHPNESLEQLQSLNEKHQVLVAEMESLTAEYDLKFLHLLNEKQYQRYMKLCVDVGRIPIPLPETDESEN